MSVNTISCLVALYLHRRGNDSQTSVSLELNCNRRPVISDAFMQSFMPPRVWTVGDSFLSSTLLSTPCRVWYQLPGVLLTALYLEWVLAPFNCEVTIVELLLVSRLFSWGLVLNNTRVTE